MHDIMLEKTDKDDEFITFFLSKEEYGVDIVRVKEIRCWESVTRIPYSAPYVKGALNLRGNIIPIVDLRNRFGLVSGDYSSVTVVIVVMVKSVSDGKWRDTGIVVDAISDVIVSDKSNVQNTPYFNSSIETKYLKGLVTNNDRMVILVDIDKILDIEEISIMM